MIYSAKTNALDSFYELGRIWAASGRQLGGIWGPLETSGTPGSHGRDCLKIIVLDI